MQQLFIHEKELAFWRDQIIAASAPDAFRPYFELAGNAFGTYHQKLVPFREEAILPGIQAVLLFGHTPGHSGYLLGDEKASLLIWGDIVHFPHIQVSQPEVTIAFDSDPAAASQVRGKMLDRAASDNLAVSGMHFNLPTTGKVIREGNGFTLNYDLWSPLI
ncbi:MAG: hypothetical protein QM578_24275 [Pantoea sp.]|uniref:hypothetical protein n=1 Tax=unclassified Pantoea TaxID=2630326 RepID=UPI0001B3F7CD|nr:hypothetical protein [Pantoea sp. At-9b]